MIECFKIAAHAGAELIAQWVADLPQAIGRLMSSDLGEINYLLSGNGTPQMLVTGEKKLSGIYDVHLFCPRRIKPEILTEGMRLVKKAFFARPDILKLTFAVLSAQNALKKALKENGCVFTGWFYVENDRIFERWVLEKDCENNTDSVNF